MTNKSEMLSEQNVLKISIKVTFILSFAGILFGLLSGSLAIVFDGMFDMVDAAMSILALFVTRLLTSEGDRRFQYGYWHVEPMVIAFNGSILILICAYGLINAIGSMLSGGRILNFDRAIVFACLMAILSFGMYLYLRQKNRKIDSEFLKLDMHSWLISATISFSLLLAFIVALFLQHGTLGYLTRYVDPFILGLLSLGLMFVPIPTVRAALQDMFLIAPSSLDAKVTRFLDELILKKGFKTYSSYVAKKGRAEFIEIYIVVPLGYSIQGVETLDAMRKEICEALGGETPRRWITIAFTTDESWI